MTGFALVLLLAAAATWIAAAGAPAPARLYLRLASVLYAALSIADIANLAPAAVTDIAATMGAGVLAVAAFAAFRKAPGVVITTVALGLATVSALVVAATGWRVFAAAPQLAGAIAVFFVARPGLWTRASIYLLLAALSLLGAAAAQMEEGMAAHAGLLLFAAASVLGVGVGSDVLVDTARRRRRGAPVSGRH
jgi:hypothetical protein